MFSESEELMEVQDMSTDCTYQIWKKPTEIKSLSSHCHWENKIKERIWEGQIVNLIIKNTSKNNVQSHTYPRIHEF